MGELDLCKDCYPYTPFDEGITFALRTVLVTYIPLAVAGILLKRSRVVHATMRGAGALRVLARLAIAIQVAAMFIPLAIAAIFVEAAWGGMSLPEDYIEFVVGSGVMVSTVWLSAAAIVAWHHMLVELASHRSEPRMLV